jgi:hypothetical protein
MLSQILGGQSSPTSPACTCPKYFILTVATSCFIFARQVYTCNFFASFLGHTQQTHEPEC